MFSKQILIYLPFSLTFLLSLAVAEPANREKPKNAARSDYETFQRLLKEVDPPSLHAALHDLFPRFKHGMFREDKNAVEIIHRDDASLATSIIKIAKRQDIVNGTFTSAVVPPESSTPIVETATPSADQATDAATAISVPISDDPATEPTPDSATLQVTTTPTVTEEAPETTSDVPVLTSDSPSPTAGSVITLTDSVGVIVVTTVNGDITTIGTNSPTETVSSGSPITSRPPSRSSVVVRTTTLPDGRKSTVTAVTVVPGDDDSATPTGDAGAASATSSEAPGVQSGVAAKTGTVMKEMLCMIAAAVGVGLLM
jgi:hypothetical protein